MADSAERLAQFSRELIDRIMSGSIKDRDAFQNIKMKMCHKYRLDTVPPNSTILAEATSVEREQCIRVAKNRSHKKAIMGAVVTKTKMVTTAPFLRLDFSGL